MKKIHFYTSPSSKAIEIAGKLKRRYGHHDIDQANQMVAIGGDGTMLNAIHTVMESGNPIPIYGINYGTLGFLMNSPSDNCLIERINNAHTDIFNPLQITANHFDGSVTEAMAVNDICVSRMSSKAVNLSINVDFEERIPMFSGDGIVVSTDIGSTAYNRSAGGPVIPLGAGIIALTPVCPIRPENFRSSLLNRNSCIYIKMHDALYRKSFFSADNKEIYNVISAQIKVNCGISFSLQFDPLKRLQILNM